MIRKLLTGAMPRASSNTHEAKGRSGNCKDGSRAIQSDLTIHRGDRAHVRASHWEAELNAMERGLLELSPARCIVGRAVVHLCGGSSDVSLTIGEPAAVLPCAVETSYTKSNCGLTVTASVIPESSNNVIAVALYRTEDTQ